MSGRTIILVRGAIKDTMPNDEAIIGRVIICAEMVAAKVLRNSKVFGIHKKYFSIRGDTSKSPKVAKKESWKPMSSQKSFGLMINITAAAIKSKFKPERRRPACSAIKTNDPIIAALMIDASKPAISTKQKIIPSDSQKARRL